VFDVRGSKNLEPVNPELSNVEPRTANMELTLCFGV